MPVIAAMPLLIDLKESTLMTLNVTLPERLARRGEKAGDTFSPGIPAGQTRKSSSVPNDV
jgi:hypothetical protein